MYQLCNKNVGISDFFHESTEETLDNFAIDKTNDCRI